MKDFAKYKNKVSRDRDYEWVLDVGVVVLLFGIIGIVCYFL
jgi:hypothetical protein